jgi:DNA invertase Pin-like site-specific DNA recombinase/DNA-binding winged helix-turn-helix (wHTH) protein
MSTDDQQYSIANQAAAIQNYATSHGYTVVATYSDPGRSGVTIQGRPGLNALLQDVVSGQAQFRAILVYDVSRWGRFQDEDEAGHYEFLCRRAGIPVCYCGEPFESNGLASNSILKALKRSMAAEFSRELGSKVQTGQKRLAGLGFRVCGLPGFGMQRCLLSADGKFKRLLKPNQRKAIKSEHVVLTPGKKTEVDIVRMIFKLAATEKRNASEIADELNRRQTKYTNGRLWRKETVHRILRSEKYIGTNVWGQTCTQLGRPVSRVPRHLWTRKAEAFTPIINATVFHRVQRLIDRRCTHPAKPDEYLLRGMRRVLAREGKLTERLLKGRGIFDHRTFLKHFGSVMRAYELVGYKPSEHAFRSVNNAKRLWSLRLQVLKRIGELFPKHVRIVRQPNQKMRQVIELNNGSRIAVSLCTPTPAAYGKQRWLLKMQPKERGLAALLCTVNMSLDRITNFYVVSPMYNDGKFVILREQHPLLTSGEKIDSLSLFYDAAIRSVRPVPSRKMVIGDVVLPSSTLTISIGSKEIDLDPTAHKLFAMLLSATDQVVSRQQLSEALPGGAERGFLTPHIHCLRKQLGSFRRRVCTVVGQGYMYTRKSMPAERLTPTTSALMTGKEFRRAS